MRIGMPLSYSGGFKETVAVLRDYEKARLDIVFVPEACSFDAISQLGFIAAHTERLEIASVLQIYTRTPTLTAMTAAGLDYVSDSRFTLGIGASGPQVIEGFHGQPYTAPLARTREIVEICRSVWRQEKVVHSGRHYPIPLPPDQGTGLGRPLKLISHPVRERVPIVSAAIGPQNVALAAEIAEGWMPMFFHPEKADEASGPALAEGSALRDPALGPLDVVVSPPLAIGESTDDLIALAQPQLALYIGGMGARGHNFSYDLARRYGYGYEAEAATIQDLYLSGRKDEAAAAVPADLLRATSLIGPASYVAERIAAFRAARVTTLQVRPLAHGTAQRLADIEALKAMPPEPVLRTRVTSWPLPEEVGARVRGRRLFSSRCRPTRHAPGGTTRQAALSRQVQPKRQPVGESDPERCRA
ncbi:LLM class F420-dependent oxidoreductase [Streptomyces sp. NPDC048254]|uniref:LLM class F420-dependent oxidoreductase n=1 Tax=Streptomyces sp. NPDC048254 TaxID=3365525 RepID=UPI0037105CEB